MTNIQVFNNEQFGEIRTTTIDGEPWFVVSDVCDYFNVSNRNRVMQQIDEDEKGGTQIDTPGGKQTVTIINESGLYNLLFLLQPTKARGVSEEYIVERQEKIKRFKRWVTHEVLPSIRKHGMYATPATIDNILNDPDFGIRLLTELKEERSKRVELEAKVEANAPKVLFSDSVAASNSCILIGQLAKQLKQNGLDIGQQRLFDRMRKDGYLCGPGNRKNLPTQRAMEMGLFQIKERTHTNPDGSVVISRTTLVTGKGQIYFTNKYLINRI